MRDLFTSPLTLLALPPTVASVLCLMAVAFIWPLRREAASAVWLFIMLGTAIVWSFAGAMESSAATMAGKALWAQISYLGIVIGPVALLHFSYAHTHSKKRLPRLVAVTVIGPGVLLLVSALANPLHGWQWPETMTVQHEGRLSAHHGHGPLFWVTMMYYHGVLLASAVMLIVHMIKQGRVFGKQTGMIALTVLAASGISIVHLLRAGPRPELEPTSIGFAIAALLLAWAVARGRLFGPGPVAANALFVHTSDPVLVIDSDERLVRANAAALRNFALTERHFGQPVTLGLAHQPELASTVCGSTTTPSPRTFSIGDTWWSVDHHSFDEAHGQSRGRIIVLRDTTDQKHSEFALLRARQQLDQTSSRADAYAREAMAANTAKSNFLSQVSHDLRTPLHVILGITEVLRARPLQVDQQNEVAVIGDAGDTLLRLINDLLDLSRIEAGRLDLAREPFQLDDVLDQIADLLGPAAQRKGLSFVHWIEPDLPGGLRGDADRLRQALFHLVGNAVKFTEHGGITLHASRQDRLLRIEISDTGRGIAAAHLSGLFNPFFRGDPEVIRGIGGSGLGLAITRRLAEAMDGKVTVRSRQGEGSVFALELPIIDDTATGPRFTRLAEEVAGRRVAVDVPDAVRRNAVIQGLRSFGAVVGENPPSHPPDADTVLIIEAAAVDGRLARDWSAAGSRVIILADPQSKPTAATVPLRRRSIADSLLASAKPSRPPFVAPTGPQRRVLLADNNALSLRVSAAQLAQCNCQVDTATGGLAVLERLAEESYDVIVLDGQMPDLNGWEVAFRLRQWPKDALNGRTPVIALTADLTPESHVRWLHAGVAVVLGKPVSTRELSDTLGRFMPRTLLPAPCSGPRIIWPRQRA